MSEKVKKKRRFAFNRKRSFEGFLYVVPWLLGFLVFFLFPLARTVFFSLNNVKFDARAGGWQYSWVGFENYKRILTVDYDLMIALQDFVVQNLLYVPVIISLSIIIAMLLNRSIRGRALFRLIFFLPIIILNGQLLRNLNTYGGMNLEIGGFIITVVEKIAPEIMVDALILLFNTILEVLWYCGVPILIFLAAMQKIDKSLYEAASIDGAGSWNMFWKITLPSIYPLVSVVIVYLVVFLANIDQNPINRLITESRYLPARREGYASAMAVIFTLVQIILITLLYLATHSRKRRDVK